MSTVLIFGVVYVACSTWFFQAAVHDSDTIVSATVAMFATFGAMLIASLAQPNGGIGPVAAVIAFVVMTAGTYVSASQHH